MQNISVCLFDCLTYTESKYHIKTKQINHASIIPQTKKLWSTVSEKDACVFSCSVMSDSFETLWIVSCLAALSMGFFRQEYRSGLPHPFSRGYSWPRHWTWVSCASCIAGRFFTHWAIMEAIRDKWEEGCLLLHGVFSVFFPLLLYCASRIFLGSQYNL